MEAPRPSAHRSGIVGGIVLIVVGLFLLAGQVVPNLGQLIPLLIGLVLLAGGVSRRVYGLIIPGCILTGIGAGIYLQDRLGDLANGGVFLLCMAAGFIAIWAVGALMRLPENHWWPWIPGSIIGVIGLFVLGEKAFGDIARWWPIALVIAGLVVIVGALTRRGDHET